jgi:hypothetical protein
MSTKDITKQILEMHGEEAMQHLMEEVRQEFKDGIPQELQSELDTLLAKANAPKKPISREVIDSISEAVHRFFQPLASTELLAAAGQSLGDWFSQPMNFGGAGFILDVRRVIGTENEVDLYLTPTDPDSENMKKTLEAYIGQSIHIVISNNDVQLLVANLFVDESGNAAEGSGHLIDADNAQDIKGKISIDIVIND